MYNGCMNKCFPTAADSLAESIRRGAAAPVCSPVAGAAATSIGASSLSGPCEASVPTGEAGAPNLSTYGPPTTSRMDGAGGPFSDWDCKIAGALSCGDKEAAKALQSARAKINLTFGILEPVWVPTDSQLMIGSMLRIGAEEGICTVLADEPAGWGLAERSAYLMGVRS